MFCTRFKLFSGYMLQYLDLIIKKKLSFVIDLKQPYLKMSLNKLLKAKLNIIFLFLQQLSTNR